MRLSNIVSIYILELPTKNESYEAFCCHNCSAPPSLGPSFGPNAFAYTVVLDVNKVAEPGKEKPRRADVPPEGWAPLR